MRGFITLSLMLASLVSFAQGGETLTIRDLESWNTVSLRFKPNKRLKFAFNEQLRLKDNASTIDQYFTELEGTYSFKKGIYAGAGLRYIRENDNKGKVTGWENHFRWQAELGYEHSLKRLKLDYRFRFQNKNELGVSSTNTTPTARFRLATTYNIPNWKLDPAFSTELFKELGSTKNFEKIRITLGTDYKLKKMGEIEAFYRLEKDTYVPFPKTTHILGLGFTYTFKK